MLDNQTVSILLSLPCIEVTEVVLEKGKIEIKCESILGESMCPNCLSKTSKTKQKSVKTVRDLPLLGREVYLEITVRQYVCENCNRHFNEKFDFIEEHNLMTKRMAKYLYECAKKESVEHICGRENIQWKTMQNIFEKYSNQDIKELRKRVVKKIGMDEFAIKKGKNNYAVVLVDLETGMVIDVLEDREKAAIIAYFKEKGQEYCDQIEVFSCDMWEGFSNAAKELFPNADVVIDRFHFFHHLNQVLDRERRRLRKKYPNEEKIKNIKWLLYKKWDNLESEEKQALLKAFRYSKELRNLYFLKNELVNIFDSEISKEAAEQICGEWIIHAQSLNNASMNIFLKTFSFWKNDVLNFFTHRVSNGIVEGINNVIKMIKRRAFGFRNFLNFRAKIMVYFF